MTQIQTTPPPAESDALVEWLFRAVTATVEIACVHLGGRLGFYRALADGGNATSVELAARTVRQSATCASGSSSGPWRAC